jgi:hypothetical protein
MSRIVSLIVGLVGISLLMTPLATRAEESIPDLLGTWTITETYADGDTVTRDWEVYVHDPDESLFFARIGRYGEEISLMTGKIAGDEITMAIDNRDGSDHWDLLTTTAPMLLDAVVTGTAERHYGVTSGDFRIEPGTFEATYRGPADETTPDEATPDDPPDTAVPDGAAGPPDADGAVTPDPNGVLGRWTWDATKSDGEVFPTHTFVVTVHDPATGVVAGDLFDETGARVTMMAGLVDEDRVATRLTFMGAAGGWTDFTGTRVPGPDRRYAGRYTVYETGETGTFEAAYVGAVDPASSGEQAGIETDPVPSEPPADGQTGVAEGTDATDGNDAVEPPVAPAVACDASRFDAALAALSGPTPYTATTVLQSYDGKSDESSFTLLAEEHVADPVTWERTTNVRGEAGWTVFESRRVGDEVWMRIDGGDWSAEAPEAGVLGTPWAHHILEAELMPGGQAADPVFFWNQVGEQCVISQLFRTEDGRLGKGKGRVSRLTFVEDEVLPRTIEWDLTYPPSGRIKGMATRPGTLESILITIAPGAVEPIETPVAE